MRTNEPLDTKKAQPGDFFQGTIVQSVYQGRAVAIPRGAQVTGRVVDVKKAGDLKGSAGFTLELTSLNLGPQPVALATDTWSLNGPGKGAYTASNAVGGAAVGAVIGAIAGRGVGAAIGAGAGTAAGLGAAAATPGPRGVIPTEALISFHLTQPVTVQPVSQQEVRQLAQNAGPEPGQQGQYAPRVGYPGPGYPPPPLCSRLCAGILSYRRPTDMLPTRIHTRMDIPMCTHTLMGIGDITAMGIAARSVLLSGCIENRWWVSSN